MESETDEKVVLVREQGESLFDFEVRMLDKKALLEMRHKCSIISIKEPSNFRNVKHTECKYKIFILKNYPIK